MQKYAGGGPCISEGHTDMDEDNKGCQTENCYNEHINNIKHKNHLNVKKVTYILPKASAGLGKEAFKYINLSVWNSCKINLLSLETGTC